MKKTLWGMMVLYVVCSGACRAAAEAVDESDSWKVKWNVEERVRYEQKYDFDFNRSLKDAGGLFFTRERIGAKASFGDKADIVVEGLNAQTGGYRIKANAAQMDDFDLHQGYFQWNHIADGPWAAKVGRMELKYGQGRLISQPAWSNRIRSFDAALVRYAAAGFGGDFFYAQDVKFDDNNFNKSLAEEFVSGAYLVFQKEKTAPLLEGYFLTQGVTTAETPTTRYTVGTRGQLGRPGGLQAEWEAPIQFGQTAEKEIRAYAFYAGVWRQFEEVFWRPKILGEYNQASGDKDPNDSISETFVPLYQGTHEPYGILDFFRWQNMRESAVSVHLSPGKKWTIIPQTNFFWLDSKFDSWVNASGTALRSQTSGDRGAYVGQEVSFRALYEATRFLKGELGYAHFFPGSYVRDSGADDAADWVYSQVIIKY